MRAFLGSRLRGIADSGNGGAMISFASSASNSCLSTFVSIILNNTPVQSLTYVQQWFKSFTGEPPSDFFVGVILNRQEPVGIRRSAFPTFSDFSHLAFAALRPIALRFFLVHFGELSRAASIISECALRSCSDFPCQRRRPIMLSACRNMSRSCSLNSIKSSGLLAVLATNKRSESLPR